MASPTRPLAAASILIATLLTGCLGEGSPSFQDLGFTSEQQMQEIQAQGWHTKARYDADMLEQRRERLLVACYAPYQHQAVTAEARAEPKSVIKVAFASEMRRDLAKILKRKGFAERDAQERIHSIYASYPPGRPEYFAQPQTAQIAVQVGAQAIKACEDHFATDTAYRAELLKRIGDFR